MKYHYKIIARVALLSMALFAAGKFYFTRIFGFFEPGIAGIFFKITDDGGKWQTSFLFSLLLALMPVIIVLAWRLGSIRSSFRTIYFVITTLAITMVAVFIRHKEVKIYFNRVVRPALLAQNRLPMQYPINPVNFVYYMIGGFLTGLIISFFLFRQKRSAVKKM